MNYSLLEDLIDVLKQYEEENGSANLSEFSAWLFEQQHQKAADADLQGSPYIHHELNESIMQQLVDIYQHARHYIKTALKSTPLKGIFDFSFLTSLDELGDLRKSDLIHYNTVEFSPGMEVIRRLIRNGLIEDYDDPNDGRSKKVRLTINGKKTLEQVKPTMSKVYHIVAGNLSLREKRNTLSGIRKLTHFHQPIWEQQHGEDLDKIATFDLQSQSVEQS
ncbi:MAG: winged helix DNA-binding protein [Saprospiraceae bacterium]|nr:winged helix DNA-binding protein [Saprospiraceae bacterium]